MAINSASCCCMPCLHRSSLPSSRSCLGAPNWKPVFCCNAPSLRLVSVRAQAPGSDGPDGPKRRVSLEHSDASLGLSSSASSVIDFLTLCHRLKVRMAEIKHSPFIIHLLIKVVKFQRTNWFICSVVFDNPSFLE